MKTKIILSILFLNIFCAFAQEKVFTIKENINDVTSKVSSFQSAISDGISDASFSDKSFETEIIIKKEEYNSDIKDNYLNSKLTVPLLITSNWNVLLEKISNTQTKVSVTLVKAISNNKVLKQEQISSNGKIEKDLKDYINNELNNSKKSPIEDSAKDSSEGKVTQMANSIQLFEKNNYSIQYPKKWKMESPGPLYEPFCLIGPKEEEYVYINLIKEEDDKPKVGEKIGAYIQRNLENLVSEDSKITNKEHVDVNSYKIEFESMAGDELFKSIRYIYMIDSDIYLLTYCSTTTYFNAYLKQAKEIIKTFKINSILKNIK